MDIFFLLRYDYIVHHLTPTWSDLGLVKCDGHEPSISLTGIPVFLCFIFKQLQKEIHVGSSFRVKKKCSA